MLRPRDPQSFRDRHHRTVGGEKTRLRRERSEGRGRRAWPGSIAVSPASAPVGRGRSVGPVDPGRIHECGSQGSDDAFVSSVVVRFPQRDFADRPCGTVHRHGIPRQSGPERFGAHGFGVTECSDLPEPGPDPLAWRRSRSPTLEGEAEHPLSETRGLGEGRCCPAGVVRRCAVPESGACCASGTDNGVWYRFPWVQGSIFRCPDFGLRMGSMVRGRDLGTILRGHPS